MLYTTDGKFIIKEHFETEKLETKSKNDNTLDIYHYDANGNLRSGTKVNNNGDYEIWTGYCYNNDCSDESKKNSHLKIDKDGTTFLKKLCIGNNCIDEDKLDNISKVSDKFNGTNDLCMDDICLTKKDLLIFKFMSWATSQDLARDFGKNMEDLSEVELALLLDELKTNILSEPNEESDN